jgi:phenylalanyl-tRNA synthetase beta chain
MRLLVSWVRDFVDVPAAPDEIAATLSLRGFEVAAVEHLGGNDAVIDFEVTANRPDCLSVLGLAREIATAYDLPLREPSHAPGAAARLASVPCGESDRVRVALEDVDLCARYAAGIAEVAPSVSPEWMTRRLHYAGLRPINPIVDVTNYVLLEIGHPLHAFDLAALEGAQLRIRRALDGERLTTLDGVERALDPEMLVIADASRPQAIAGVMGGIGSEVSAATRVVAFESAWFKPASVRRTSRRLGLATEASFRFERGADISLPVVALQRAFALIDEIGAGGVSGPIVDRYPVPREPRTVDLRRARMASLLGINVPDEEVVRILRRLGLGPTGGRDGWSVVVPTFRVDLSREVDLVEEVGRHYGFDRIQPTFPVMAGPTPPPDARVARDQIVRRVLTAAGLSEAVTFGFIEARAAARFPPAGGDTGTVAVANPLSSKFDVLRPWLLPGLLDALAHNRRHGRRDVALFEIGCRFTAREAETRGVGLAWTGRAAPEHWSSGARDVDFFDVKGLVERLVDALGASVTFRPAAVPFLLPGRAASVHAGPVVLGVAGEIAPAIAEACGAPRQDPVFAAELNLDRLADAVVPASHEWVRPLPRHPAVVRDLSIVVPGTLPAEIISGTIQAAAGPGEAPLVGVEYFDRYSGKGVPEGSMSVSVHLTFQAPDRTLKDAEVQHSVDLILAALRRDHGAVQR